MSSPQPAPVPDVPAAPGLPSMPEPAFRERTISGAPGLPMLAFGALLVLGAAALIAVGSLETNQHHGVLGGVLMILAACVAALLAANAERRSLEDVAPPLSAVLRAE